MLCNPCFFFSLVHVFELSVSLRKKQKLCVVPCTTFLTWSWHHPSLDYTVLATHRYFTWHEHKKLHLHFDTIKDFCIKDLYQFSVALFNDDIGHAVNLVQLQVLLMERRAFRFTVIKCWDNSVDDKHVKHVSSCKLQNIQCILMQETEL